MTEKNEKNTISTREYIVRFVLAAGLFVFGINIFSSAYFYEYPLFGIPLLGELLSAFVLGLIGFFLVPKYFMIVKNWVEGLVVLTTQKVVEDFWNQYMRRMEENRNQKRKENQKKESHKKKKKQMSEKLKDGILLDTSVLIDGRILEVSKTGFLLAPLIVPKFVIAELKLLADNKDDIKRKKGRRGLEMINQVKKKSKVLIVDLRAGEFNKDGNKTEDLQKNKTAPAKNHKKNGSGDEGVDEELLKLAREYRLRIMTLDYNLNKVAEASNIQVLNLNKLAESLKPDFIPGEKLTIDLVQKGKEKGQGVGYLKDGTMVVVADSSSLIGSKVEVEVVKLLQTEAGKMVFSEKVKQSPVQADVAVSAPNPRK